MAHGGKFDGCNFTYNPPEGVSEEQCGKLHVFRNGACIVSAHELTDEELEEITRTRRVFHSVWSGDRLAPIFIGSETTVRAVVVDFGPVWKSSQK